MSTLIAPGLISPLQTYFAMNISPLKMPDIFKQRVCLKSRPKLPHILGLTALLQCLGIGMR